MNDLEKRLHALKLVPVVSLPSVDAGVRLAELLTAHGFGAAEVTFRTPSAAGGIAAMKKQFPQLLLLAGTVLNPAQADAALEAGAEVIVSPGTEATLVDYCQSLGVPIVPGVCTPSEIQTALAKGLSLLKFFPAEQAGGIPLLKTMLAVYRDVSFMPTGGITSANLRDYLAIDRVPCCGGTWLAPEPMLRDGDWPGIAARLKDAADVLAGG